MSTVIIGGGGRAKSLIDAAVSASVNMTETELETCQCLFDDFSRDLKEMLGNMNPPIVPAD